MVYLPNSTNIREIKFQTVVVKGEKLSQAKYSNLAHLIKVCDISQWIWVLNRRLFFISMLEPFLRKIAPTRNLKQFHISYIIKTIKLLHTRNMLSLIVLQKLYFNAPLAI